MSAVPSGLLEALAGRQIGGAHICENWELRITRRCLVEDLGTDAAAAFSDVANRAIIRTFIDQRSTRTEGTRAVSPLPVNRDVQPQVLGRGTERACTLFDDSTHTVWLVAYHPQHRSGEIGDFYPWVKSLDAEGRLLPTRDDYLRSRVEQSELLAKAIMVQAPLILRDARAHGGEFEAVIGHRWGTKIAVVVADDLESVTIAFDLKTTPRREMLVILAAFYPDSDWTSVTQMPNRPVDLAAEVAWEHVHYAPEGEQNG